MLDFTHFTSSQKYLIWIAGASEASHNQCAKDNSKKEHNEHDGAGKAAVPLFTVDPAKDVSYWSALSGILCKSLLIIRKI